MYLRGDSNPCSTHLHKKTHVLFIMKQVNGKYRCLGPLLYWKAGNAWGRFCHTLNWSVSLVKGTVLGKETLRLAEEAWAASSIASLPASCMVQAALVIGNASMYKFSRMGFLRTRLVPVGVMLWWGQLLLENLPSKHCLLWPPAVAAGSC